MAEMVFKTRFHQGTRVYHTDPDCPNLRRSTTVREVPKDSLWSDTRECKECSGERDPSDGGWNARREPATWSVCRSCGAELESDGTCAWCEKAEELGIV